MLLFNRYEYNPQTDIAGKGAFSRVYRAVDRTNGETVAVKMYKVNDLSDHYHSIRDTEIIKTLDHPALCGYLDIFDIEKEDSFGETEILQVCITGFMNAGDLLEGYKRNQDLLWLGQRLEEILNGLSYLHKKGFIHGNIKPSNLLLSTSQDAVCAKITDHAMGSSYPLTAAGTGAHAGLPAIGYCSPEQLNAGAYGQDQKLSFNTDLWSLALVLYEALCEEPVFKIEGTESPETISHRITGFELPARVAELPQPFATFLQSCLIKEAGRRAQTAEELLPLFLNATAVTAARPVEDEEYADNTRIIAPAGKKEPSSIPVPLTAQAEDARATAAVSMNQPASPRIPEDAPVTADEETRIIRPAAVQQPATEAPDDDATQFVTDLPNGKTRSGETANAKDDSTLLQPTDGIIDNYKEMDEGATQVIPSSMTNPAPNETTTAVSQEKDEADTALLATGFSNTALQDTALDDATRIISSRTDLSGVDAEKSNSDKQSADPRNEEDETGTDKTIIISSLPKEKQASEKSSRQSASAGTAKTSNTGILIGRREKPVLLFNRYEYGPASDLIGKGGFSRVYKAFDKKLSRWVALKVYKTGEFSDRYSPIAEIKRVVNLDHPNICRYLDIEEIENENPFGENEKIQVCVMELLDSGNIAEYYKANKNPDILKKLVQDILNGLSYLHKNGIIHRDIKPANILIKQTIEGPVAKITDFGISKNSDSDNNNSSSALIVSIPYMAPEQLNAKKYGINDKVTYNLDLWSLGVTVYEIFTGKVLFKNTDQDNSEQIMANIIAPELPEKLNDLPEPFKTLVSHCVVKNARERAARAEELMVLLHTVETTGTTSSLVSEAANMPPPGEQQIMEPIKKPVAINVDDTIGQTTVAPVDKTSKSRFSLEEREERVVETNEGSKNKVLYTVIGIAVFLFLVFIIYLKACNPTQVPPVENSSGLTNKDSVQKSVTMPAVADSLKQNDSAAVKKIETTAAATEKTTVPVHKAEKTKERSAEEVHRKPVIPPAVNKTTTATKYVLLLSSETDCSLKVNGITYGEIKSGGSMKIFLVAGKYVLQFVKSSNSASVYTANIEVKPENLGHADKFRVPLR